MIRAGFLMSENRGHDPKPRISLAIQDKIGRELRAMYEELLKQPLPEKLTAPLRAMEEVQASREQLRETLDSMRQVTPAHTGSTTPSRKARSA